ncbi:hypothetical protein BpHYR1_003218, partial [Brachionus plicatilis]
TEVEFELALIISKSRTINNSDVLKILKNSIHICSTKENKQNKTTFLCIQFYFIFNIAESGMFLLEGILLIVKS